MTVHRLCGSGQRLKGNKRSKACKDHGDRPLEEESQKYS